MSEGSADSRIVVLCPLEIEAKAVVRALGAGRSCGVEVRTTGPGPEAVARAVRAVDDRAAAVLLCGVAGGLSPTVGSGGEVRAINRVVDRHGQAWRPIFGVEGPSAATIVGVDAVVSTVELKRALRDQTGADLVDTESHAFAAACEAKALRWGIVRGVSDGAEEALPAEMAAWVDAAGRTRIPRILRDLLLRPGLVPHVRRIGARTNHALRGVGRRVQEIVAREQPTPLPASLANASIVILFGGTFDPPHRAHAELPERVRAELERRAAASGEAKNASQRGAWLAYVPAARNPLKDEGPRASDADRTEMLCRAIAGNPRAVVWTDDVDRAAKSPGSASYTVDTIRRASAQLPQSTTLRLLIGADQAAAFHRWRAPRQILALAEPVVMLRAPAESTDDLLAHIRASGFWSDAEVEAWRGRIVEVGCMDVSATAVRDALRRGDRRAAAAMVGGEVMEVIDQRGLYAPFGAGDRADSPAGA